MNKMKKFIFVAGLAVVALGTQAFGASIAKSTTYAETNTEYEIITSLSNPSFKSDGSFGLSNPPSSWTEISHKGQATKGVINTGNTFASYQKETYQLEGITNPGTANDADVYALMINSKVNGAENGAVQGFKSNTITLDAYSYYAITVYAKTVNAHASIVLSGYDEDTIYDVESTYMNINSNLDSYAPYTFFVSTAFDKQDMNIELYLGTVTDKNQTTSTGVVFFDDIQIKKYSQKAVVQEFMHTNNAKMATFEGYQIYQDNFDFENGLNGKYGTDAWEILGGDHNDNYSIQTTNDAELGFDNTYSNTKALVLTSEDDNFIGVKSPKFEIKKNGYYRLAINAKALDLSGNAHLKLVETDILKTDANKYEPKSTSLSFGSTEANALKNGYNTFEFYISGHELYDTELNLELSLGNADAKASGKVAFDSITFEYITYDQFNSVTTSSKIAKLELTTISSDSSINGFFNQGYSQNAEITYPLIPEKWTRTAGDDNDLSVFGVANTADWTGLSLPNPYNPSRLSGNTFIPVPNGTSNNILLAHNNSATSYQIIESPELAISSNSYYTLSFNYLAHGDKILNVKVIDENDNLVYQDLGLASDSWQFYKITINSEYYSSTLKLVFEVGTEDNTKQGYAFFDNVQLVQETDYEDSYNAIVNSNGNIIDFSNAGFNMTGVEIENGIFEALMFKNNNANGAVGGIVTDEYAELIFPATHTSSVKKMLAINTYSPCDYNLTSKNTIQLSKDTFYLFSVYIKTDFEQDISTLTSQDFGAYFEISGVTDAKISNIKTTAEAGFTLYSIYVKSDAETTANVKFGYVTTGTETHGTAFFDTFTYQTIDQATYKKATEGTTLLKVNNVGLPEDEEDDTSSTSVGEVNIWIALSTIVMLVAMVIAIVGAFLRKTKIKKYRVKRQAEYDRKATLIHDAVYAEAEQRRTAEVKALQKEKEQLETYITELDEDNKKRLAEQRKSHGKEITRHDEKQFKIYASQRQKLVKDVEKMEQRIKEAKSPEYLMRIIKMVQTEKVNALIEKERQQKLSNPKSNKQKTDAESATTEQPEETASETTDEENTDK